MFYEQRLNELINANQDVFLVIFQEYQDNCSGHKKSFDEWDQIYITTEDSLKKQILEIENRYLLGQILSTIKCRKDNTDDYGYEFNYDKFSFYVSQIKNMKVRKKTLRYNSSFCKSIINVIVSEYFCILNYLKKKKDEFKIMEKCELENANEKVRIAWKRMNEEWVDAIIEAEYQAVIEDITSQVASM